MGRVKASDDLLRIREDYMDSQKRWRHQVLACGGAGCISPHCQGVRDALEGFLRVNGLKDTVHMIITGRTGTRAAGPVPLVEPGGIFYASAAPEKTVDMVTRHLVDEEICEECTFYDSYKEIRVPRLDDVDPFKRQIRIALRNCGHTEPISMEVCIIRDGHQSISRALSTTSQADVMEQIKASGLRGRGGAGFPIGVKWDAGMKTISKSGIKYMICNADEGDLGAFVNHSLLEDDPHNITRGMMIDGYATDASRGFVYIRAEYSLAVERLSSAIAQAREAELLGSDILGIGFSFGLEIRIGADAFVCGEETSLLSSVKGRRGEPHQRPPFPSESELLNEPTIINNVETLANIVPVILYGADWYRQLGTEKSTGTKMFTLAGDIENSDIIEVPMGILLGGIIYKIGGGIKDGEKFKVIQPGGPSGSCLICEHLNTRVDYESLAELGAIMGSDSLVVTDEGTCMVDTAWYLMDFIRDEPCGKCLPRRNGTKRMLEILERIIEGRGKGGDLELLEKLAETIKQTAMCSSGQTILNLMFSTLRYFRQEYETHIYDKHCEADVCAESQEFPCRNVYPAYVHAPGYISLLLADRIDETYQLIRQDSSLPSVYGRVCTHPCEDHCHRSQADESTPICSLERLIDSYALRDDYTIPRIQPRPVTGRKVSIIGTGPFDLTRTYYLANLGHQVDIYNSEPVAGSAPCWDIPEYRLPKEVLTKEVRATEMAGVNIHLNTRTGDDIFFEQLRTDSGAIYVVAGTQESRLLNMPGKDLKGVESRLIFLKRIGPKHDMSVPKRLVVIGGGSTAMDVTRIAIRLGSGEVTTIYRRIEKGMPAETEEIAEAREEGINIITMASLKEFLGEDGKVTAIRLVRRGLTDYGRDSKRMSRHIEGSDSDLECDGITTAVNQDVDHLLYHTANIGFGNRGWVGINQFATVTSEDGVFADGDVSPWGRNVVITTIVDGKRVASNTDRYSGESGELNHSQTTEVPDVEGFEVTESHKRFPVKTLSPEERKDNFKEVACGSHKLDAVAEALRCLHCNGR